MNERNRLRSLPALPAARVDTSTMPGEGAGEEPPGAGAVGDDDAAREMGAAAEDASAPARALDDDDDDDGGGGGGGDSNGNGDGGDGDGGDDGRIFPEHPSPILHAPRDIISRKGKSLTPIKQTV